MSNIIQQITSGLSGLLIKNVYEDVKPFLMDEAKIMVQSGEALFNHLTNPELTSEERSKLIGLWKGNFTLFVKALMREGATLRDDLLEILLQTGFDELTTFLGFGND